jgi:hypothetical protein
LYRYAVDYAAEAAIAAAAAATTADAATAAAAASRNAAPAHAALAAGHAAAVPVASGDAAAREKLGANVTSTGTHFAVWAPHAVGTCSSQISKLDIPNIPELGSARLVSTLAPEM